MSKANTYEQDLLALLFNGTAIAGVATNTTTAPYTNLWCALHTGDPTDTGGQSSLEVAYTAYTRIAVARTTAGWVVTTSGVSPAANIDFPTGTSGSGTVTHFSVGADSGGTGKIFYSGTVTPNIVCGNGVTPRLTTVSAITED